MTGKKIRQRICIYHIVLLGYFVFRFFTSFHHRCNHVNSRDDQIKCVPL